MIEGIETTPGLFHWPVGLLHRPVGLLHRPVDLPDRPVGLLYMQREKKLSYLKHLTNSKRSNFQRKLISKRLA